jgi:hypothetical protein
MTVQREESIKFSGITLDYLSDFQRRLNEEEDMKPLITGVMAIRFINFKFMSEIVHKNSPTANYYLHSSIRNTSRHTNPSIRIKDTVTWNQHQIYHLNVSIWI